MRVRVFRPNLNDRDDQYTMVMMIHAYVHIHIHAYITLMYVITYIALHDIPLHYITLCHIILYYITLH